MDHCICMYDGTATPSTTVHAMRQAVVLIETGLPLTVGAPHKPEHGQVEEWGQGATLMKFHPLHNTRAL